MYLIFCFLMKIGFDPKLVSAFSTTEEGGVGGGSHEKKSE